MFTLYSAEVTGNPGNCSYPHKHVILDEASLKAAICHDYVCAEYKNSYRNGENFIGSDCLPVDCDNDHSEKPEDWVTPDDVMQAFPGVTFAHHYSRFHNREKNGKPARPKFHVLFPIEYVTDAALYSDMKKLVNSIFPYFDTQALDAARFFFGTTAAEVALYPGRMNLTEYLDEDIFDEDMAQGQYDSSVIPEGSRNATMSRFAGKVIKKYGDSDKAYQAFLEEAAKCVPPLDNSELSTIWHSAQRFYARLSQQDGYVAPEVYNDPSSYKPGDYSDVGQAEVLAKYFSNELRYSPATHFIRYSDHYWQESEPGAQAVAHELTRRQLKEANQELMEALDKMKNCGAQTILEGTSKAKAEQLMNDDQLQAYQEFLAAKVYQVFAIKRRDSKYITSTLKESHPMLEISPRDLDADCFALCTPEATYDLRKGMAGAREHSPEDFITKITSVSPSQKGQQIWLDCLDLIFQGDQSLIDYVQMICGLAAIGKVYVEALIIAYGDGRNGKSTFWNAISRVLGLYSGNLSADTLTVGCRRNIKPEMAEVKGKRLLIAAEMQEGSRLNDSTVKQLCSTDDVFAEKKYKDPFSSSLATRWCCIPTICLVSAHPMMVSGVALSLSRSMQRLPARATSRITASTCLTMPVKAFWLGSSKVPRRSLNWTTRFRCRKAYRRPLTNTVTRTTGLATSSLTSVKWMIPIRKAPRRCIRHTATTLWTATSISAARQTSILRWRRLALSESRSTTSATLRAYA